MEHIRFMDLGDAEVVRIMDCIPILPVGEILSGCYK